MWNEDVTKAFNHLKRVMTHPLVLALLDHNKLFYGGSECFKDNMGVMLMQKGHPITYINKPLGLK